jgi:hypothetical protein
MEALFGVPGPPILCKSVLGGSWWTNGLGQLWPGGGTLLGCNTLVGGGTAWRESRKNVQGGTTWCLSLRNCGWEELRVQVLASQRGSLLAFY